MKVKGILLVISLFVFVSVYGQDNTTTTTPPTDNTKANTSSAEPEKKKPYPNSNLEWDKSEVKQADWIEANKFCSGKGMRLPTKEELKFGYSSGDKQLREKQENFWSSEYVITERDSTWYVHSGTGRSFYAPRSTKQYVRCVKGSLFGDKKDDAKHKTVPAEMDGELISLKPYKFHPETGKALNYYEAVKFCEDKKLKLADRYELQKAYNSKVDKLRDPEGDYISSSPVFAKAGTFWFVNFKSGFSNPGSPYSKYNVRCVQRPEKAGSENQSKSNQPNQQPAQPNK